MRRFLPVPLITAAAVLLATCGLVISAASAGAASGTVLHTAKVKIDGHKETIVVNAAGHAVYLLTGDSTRHPECTSGACLGVWPAVTGTRTSTSGISAKVTIWKHKGLHQLELAGHPLYTYIGDGSAGEATGQGIRSFGGVWYVLSASGKAIG